MNNITNNIIDICKDINITLDNETIEILNDATDGIEINDIVVYTKNDIEEFRTNMRLEDTTELSMAGNHKSRIQYTHTAVGVNISYGINESRYIIESDNKTIVTIINNNSDAIVDEDEMVITVVETIEWDTSISDKLSTSFDLHFYIPVMIRKGI